MKKTLFLFFFFLTLSSCKKDYTCTCRFGVESNNVTLWYNSVSTSFSNVTRGNAKKKCEAEEFVYNSSENYDSLFTSCKLD